MDASPMHLGPLRKSLEPIGLGIALLRGARSRGRPTYGPLVVSI